MFASPLLEFRTGLVAGRVLREQRRVDPDDVERRSQVVAHNREKLVAGDDAVLRVCPPCLLFEHHREGMLDRAVRVLPLAHQMSSVRRRSAARTTRRA